MKWIAMFLYALPTYSIFLKGTSSLPITFAQARYDRVKFAQPRDGYDRGGRGRGRTGLITATSVSGPEEVIIIVRPSDTFTEFAHIAKVPVSCDTGTVAASGLRTIGSTISTQASAGRELLWLAFNCAILFICGSTDSYAGLPFPNVLDRPPVDLVRLLVRRPGLVVVLVLAATVVVLGGCLGGDQEGQQDGGGDGKHLDLAEEDGGRREDDRPRTE